MGCGLGSAPWRPVRARGSESTPTAPAPAVREGWAGGGPGLSGRPHPRRAPAGGGDRGRHAGRGVCGSYGRGLRPSNSRLLAPRSPGGRGGRTWRRRGGGAAVTAEGGVWARRGSARVRGCGSAGVSPGCVRVPVSEFVLGSAGSGGASPGECWGCGPSPWALESPCAFMYARLCVCPAGGAPGSAMARARQEGSSPEPVEGLARDGPRPFPLSRLVPSAVSCGLCEPGLPAAPAAPALLPAAYLCAPTAPPAVTAALGGPRWPGGPRSRPRGPRPDGPQPSLSPAEQHLESPVPSAPGALAGGPTQAAPGVRGEEEQWAREIGAQLRRMADDLNALYERRRQEEQQRHRPSPWRVLYNLIMGLLPLPRARGAPEMEPN
uniref:BCL2 binding component 3 n=3 Tax=Felidae TaxID=9681 RepID=A0ABI8AE43_FELCA